MLVLRWDVLVVVPLVVLVVIYLMVQLVMRFDAARLLAARRLAVSSRTDEPNLCDRLPSTRFLLRQSSPSRRRIS